MSRCFCYAATVLLELCQAADDSTLVALVERSGAPLASWLTAPPTDASPEALLLALRLWPRLPAAVVQSCPLLPEGFHASTPLPANLFMNNAGAANSKAVAVAAAAFFTRHHLTALLPVLRATTQSHPRLHIVWPTLLALLMPGFSAEKVGGRQEAAGLANSCLTNNRGTVNVIAICQWPSAPAVVA